MRIRHDGLAFDTDSPQWLNLEPERRERVLAQGTIQARDGTLLTGRKRQRMVVRILGTYDHLPLPSTHGLGQRKSRRWLVPDLWPWGTIPMLGGNPKAGKTTLVVDLVTSLLVPGRRFLDHFEPADLTVDERGKGIWLVNAETPAEDIEAAFAAGLAEATTMDPDGREHCAADLLVLDHLEALGGPGMFDLTQPDNYDLWANRFVECETCDGTDDWSPAVVIVDGLTAILQAVGKGTESYGPWYAAFRRLMHELDVPNALAVGHSTLAGNHLMGGVEAQAGPDGLWVYSSDDADRPSAARRFSVVPRLGGKSMNPTRVVWSEEGRLRLGSGPPDEPKPRKPDPSADEQVMADLRAAGAAGIMTTDLTGRGAEGQYRRDALRRLLASGQAVERTEGRVRRLWARESAPAGLRGRDRPEYGLEHGDLRSEASDGPGG